MRIGKFDFKWAGAKLSLAFLCLFHISMLRWPVSTERNITSLENSVLLRSVQSATVIGFVVNYWTTSMLRAGEINFYTQTFTLTINIVIYFIKTSSSFKNRKTTDFF